MSLAEMKVGKVYDFYGIPPPFELCDASNIPLISLYKLYGGMSTRTDKKTPGDRISPGAEPIQLYFGHIAFIIGVDVGVILCIITCIIAAVILRCLNICVSLGSCHFAAEEACKQ